MLYTWNLKMWGENDGPELNASLGTSILMAMHLLIIYQIFGLIIKDSILSDLPKYILIGIMGIIILLNIFLFVYKKKYLLIIKRYENDNKNERKKKIIISLFFLIISILIFFVLIFISIPGSKES